MFKNVPSTYVTEKLGLKYLMVMNLRFSYPFFCFGFIRVEIISLHSFKFGITLSVWLIKSIHFS